jgi:hypothetical protein
MIAIAAILLIALACIRWWREGHARKLLFLRVLILGALLMILVNPMVIQPREQQGKPKLVVLVDTSSSMATADVGGNTRLDTALGTLTNPPTLAVLNRDFILDVRRFDRDLRAADPATLTGGATGDATDLHSALMTAVSDIAQVKSQAGILLVSDGRATTEGTDEAGQLALARSTPIWAWTLGGPVPRHDLWIDTASSEALAFSGTEVELTATLHADGYANRSFKVEILSDDKVIETREVIPATNGLAKISVKVKAPDSGEHRYVFRTPPQPDEAESANNERAVFLRSVGNKARVLIAEGQPHWDTKFLVQSLKRDSRVDLTVVYRLNATRHLAIVSSTGSETRVEKDLFPRTAETMNQFDVIVLGRGAEAFFDASTESLLTDYVSKRGGNLIFGRGKAYGGRFQALSKLEPLAWGEGSATSVKLRVTEAGRDNPVFDLGASGSLDELMDRLPALDQASVTLGEKPLAVILASASSSAEGPALLAYQRYGQGKVMSLNASGLWRWAFRENGQDESEAAYQRFWVSLLQWLLSGSQFLPGADVSLTSTRRYYTSDQPMQFLIATRNMDRAAYQPKLIIQGGGKSVEVEPRPRGEVFVAEAGPFVPGAYTVTLTNNIGKPSTQTQSIEVVSASIEKRDVSADPQTMARLAQVSGGTVVITADISKMGDIVRKWQAGRDLANRRQPLWDRWWLLGLVIGLVGLEWWLRRREGLL